MAPFEKLPCKVACAFGSSLGASICAQWHAPNDATYVALAKILDCPLITADRRLARRARSTGHVRLLGES